MKILHKMRGLRRESEATCLYGNKYLFIKTCENQEKILHAKMTHRKPWRYFNPYIYVNKFHGEKIYTRFFKRKNMTPSDSGLHMLTATC